MRCPICQREMLEIREGSTIGRLPGRPELDLKQVIGYNCPVQNNLPHGTKTPHYTIRGLNEVVVLFPYRVSTWNSSEGDADKGTVGAKAVSTIYHYSETVGKFTEVCNTPRIKWDTEERMLQKLAIYVLFS